MLQQRKHQKNLSASLKENDQTLANIGNLPNRLNSFPSKSPLDNSKHLSKSAAFQDLKPSNNSRKRKQEAPKEKKALAKSVIKEKPNKTPPKDWAEPTESSELKSSSVKESPVQTEKAVAYEIHFPALGSEAPKAEVSGSEIPKSESTFSIDLLSPGNVAVHQVYKDFDLAESCSIVLQGEDKTEEKLEEPEQKQEQEPEIEVRQEQVECVEEQEPKQAEEREVRHIVKDEVTLEYENQFPALGCEVELVKETQDFDMEILSPKHLKVAVENDEQVNLTSTLGEWEALVTPEQFDQEEEQKPAEEVTNLDKEQNDEYIKIEKQMDVSTQIEMVDNSQPTRVEIQREILHQDIEVADEESGPETFDHIFDAKPVSILCYEELVPQVPLDSTAEDVEPEPPVCPKDTEFYKEEQFLLDNNKALVPEEFEERLATEIEQQDEANLIANEDNEVRFEGEEQHLKQEEQLKEYEADIAEKFEVKEDYHYKHIKVPILDEEAESLLEIDEETTEKEPVNVVEEEFGNYKTAAVAVQPKEQEKIKRSAPPQEEVQPTIKSPIRDIMENKQMEADDQDELKSIEEDIAVASEDEDIQQGAVGGSLKSLDRNEPQEPVKMKGRSSLEYIPEDPSLSQSTDLTLSAQRIDLIKEEIREADERKRNQDALFKEVEKNLVIVKGLESSKMYGAAINVLKKSLDVLDNRLVRHHDTNVQEINRLSLDININLSYFYNYVNDFRLSAQYARAALNLDSKNVKALYFLGIGLLRCKDKIGGYNALREAVSLTPQLGEEEYCELAEIELRKYDRKVEEAHEKSEIKAVTPVTELATLKKINKIEKKERKSPRVGSLGYFVGTAMGSGLASWFITRNYLNMSEKKSLAYSIGIGALIGGISVLIFGHTRSARSVGKK